MYKKTITLLLTIVLLIPANLVFAEESQFQWIDNPILLIEKDYLDSLLTLDEKALLQVKAIRNQDNLPLKYRQTALLGEKSGLRCATFILIEIKKSWELLSEKTRSEINLTLARWPTDSTYDSPGGFFKLHYDLVGPDSVPSADMDFSNIPDFIEKCAAYCDSAYGKHLELVYLTPPSDNGLGGDDKLDIYFDSMSIYGYVVPEGPGSMPWNDFYSYMVLNSTFTGFPPNNDPEGQVAGATKATAAHEYHHCVQLAYDYTEESWFMELDATYIEDIVFDLVDDNYNMLNYFMDYPQTSLMDNNSNHKYGSFIWGIFLSEQFDTSLLVSVWEGARYNTVFNTLSDTLLNNYGWTQDSAFAEFSVWNFCTSTRDDGQHYEEGLQYLPISISQTHTVYPVNSQNSLTDVGSYAASYITFYPEDNIGKLHITFNGLDSHQWAAYLVKSTAENIHEFEKLILSPDNYLGEIEVAEFENYYSVTLIGINITEFDTEALFSYSANIILPYSVSSQILTLDSSIYSGGLRYFDYQVFNTSPLNDIFNIIVWDELGWITPDTIDYAISSGDSAFFSIPVHPPQGTPLESVSQLYFKAQSWGDTSVTNTQTAVGKIFLQRGDLDFSGQIDIADIVYFVDYSFGSGPAPLPIIEAADFDCTIEVNISDLVAMVEYSFHNGPPAPCNPY